MRTPEHNAKISAALKGRKKGPLTEEDKRKISAKLKGRVFSDEHRNKLRLAMLGKKRKPFSKEWKAKLAANLAKHRPSSRKPEWNEKLSVTRKALGVARGAKNPNWKGGVSTLNDQLRRSDEYKAWRKAVYERDGYRCVCCGAPGTGRNLHAHHKKPMALLIRQGLLSLLWDVSNGVTLCVSCHKETDSYGWKAWNNFLKKVT